MAGPIPKDFQFNGFTSYRFDGSTYVMMLYRDDGTSETFNVPPAWVNDVTFDVWSAMRKEMTASQPADP